MITLSEIARVTGFSRSAVSKALLNGGGKTTKVSASNIALIRQAAARLGYRPNLLAQGLANKDLEIIGVIIDSQCCGLYNEILKVLESLTFSSGYRLQVGLVHDTYEGIKKYVDDFLGYNIQNVICLAHYYNFAELVPPLFESFKNPLFISKPMTDKKVSFVSPDYYGNFYAAVDHLLSTGHRRIVYARMDFETYDAKVREQAFRDAHAAHNVKFQEEQIFRKNLMEIDSSDLMDTFLAEILPLEPDALILGNAVAINWCIRKLREKNLRVPEDISIVGMDYWEGSQAMNPSITVIDNNYMEIGKQAVELILNNAKTEKPQKKEIFVKGKLIIGESCSKKQTKIK